MKLATPAEIETACMTRSADEAHTWLLANGLLANKHQLHAAIALMIEEGRRQKLSNTTPSPVIIDVSRHAATTSCRALLRRMLATDHHFFRDGDQDRMASALREAGMVPA